MRGMRLWLTAGMALSLAVVASPASADVTVGTPDGSSNAFPFTTSYNGTYQQVYGSTAFAGPTTINTVQFYTDPLGPPPPNSNSYTLSFYLTTNAVDGLSTDPSANETTLLSSFGTFVPGLSYTFTGNSFTYDPSLGNLLMNVSTSSTIGTSAFLLTANVDSDATSRLFRSSGSGVFLTNTQGLVTTFSLTGGVPEPSTWAMMLLGFAGIGIAVRRRGAGKTPQAA